MRRSLFSLLAGCLAALVVDSFTAQPLYGAIFHRPANNCSASQAADPRSKSVSGALAGSRNMALRLVTCEPPAAPALAF